MNIRPCKHNDRPHLEVTTPQATWLHDCAGGGIARLIDRDDCDWIAFRPDPLQSFPASAAAGFRGLGNLVFGGQHDGAGHPGFDRCESKLEGRDTIRVHTHDRIWAWRWQFHADHTVFTMETAPADQPWWFLYEGPIAGRFAPLSDEWASDSEQGDGRLPGIDQQHFATWQWVGLRPLGHHRALWLGLDSRMPTTSTLWWMGAAAEGRWSDSREGMVVCGFGRGPNAQPLLRGPGWRVVIALLEAPQSLHDAGRRAAERWLDQPINK